RCCRRYANWPPARLERRFFWRSFDPRCDRAKSRFRFGHVAVNFALLPVRTPDPKRPPQGSGSAGPYKDLKATSTVKYTAITTAIDMAKAITTVARYERRNKKA